MVINYLLNIGLFMRVPKTCQIFPIYKRENNLFKFLYLFNSKLNKSHSLVASAVFFHINENCSSRNIFFPSCRLKEE